MDEALMKTLVLILASFFASGQIMQPAGIVTTPTPVAGCTTPSFVDDWPMWGASNTCSGGSACTNGAGIDTVVDTGTGANNGTQATSGSRPIYATGAINGLAGGTFTSSKSLIVSSLCNACSPPRGRITRF